MILFCPPLLGEQGLGDANRDTKRHLAARLVEYVAISGGAMSSSPALAVEPT